MVAPAPCGSPGSGADRTVFLEKQLAYELPVGVSGFDRLQNYLLSYSGLDKNNTQ